MCIMFEMESVYTLKLFFLGPFESVYKKKIKNPVFWSSSVFLIVLHPPSGVENSIVVNTPLSYI